MFCRALSIAKNSHISKLVFCDASRVITRISSAKGESSFRGILSISKSVGNSSLSLVAALINPSIADGVLSKL